MHKAQETVLVIDMDALAHNYRYLKSKLAPQTKFLGVVKAFAYGSDMLRIARELQELGADYLAVAYVREGVLLRQGGVTLPILVLHPQAANFELLIEHQLEPSLYAPKILKLFLALAKEKELKAYPVHLKFNTGLNRLGFWENDIDYITSQLKGTTALHIQSIFSHLAASEDENEREFTENQITTFQKIEKEVQTKITSQCLKHLLNTSGILNYPEGQWDMVRSGIGLYGFGNNSKENLKLKPVASLKTVISQIHAIEPGESVGYNRAFVSEGYRKTATLPLGHADGIGRHFGNGKTFVYVKGQPVPIVGNVCMDMIMIDITGVACQEGDEVIVFGDNANASAESFAASGGTISYELLTGISQRIKRIFIGGTTNN